MILVDVGGTARACACGWRIPPALRAYSPAGEDVSRLIVLLSCPVCPEQVSVTLVPLEEVKTDEPREEKKE